jgi:Family of unknown function (DUF5719)
MVPAPARVAGGTGHPMISGIAPGTTSGTSGTGDGVIGNRLMALAGVVLALAAAAGLAVWKHTATFAAGQPVAQARAVPVSTVLRACPAVGQAGSPAGHIALVAGPSAAGTGRAVLGYSGTAPGTPLASLTKPGALSVTKVPGIAVPAHTKTAHTKPAHSAAPAGGTSGQAVTTLPVPGGVVIQASGSMARGLEAEQTTGTGQAAVRCDGPGTDFWFTGPGVFTAPHIHLYLMNTGSQPADVSVQAFTDAGPLVGSADTGIAVAPHTMVFQSLGGMLHGTRAVALHVRTSVGQVVAAVEEFTSAAHSGTWLPAVAPPANQIVLPGLPQTAGTRQLFLTVPGTSDAHITLRAITSKGTYEPTGGGGLDIPGGSVAQLSLTSLSAVPGALEVSSNVPVTAALMIPGGPKGTPGVFTAASAAIQDQGVVAESVSGGGAASALVLSAPWRAVRAKVTLIPEGSAGQAGAATSSVVQVPAHNSLVDQLGRAGARHGATFAVVVTPLAGSGPLYAARVTTASGKGGALQSILPVPSALTTVALPGARIALISPPG